MVPAICAGKGEQQAADKSIACPGGIDDIDAWCGKMELPLGGNQQRAIGPQRNDRGVTAKIAQVITRILPVTGPAELAQLICRDFADRSQCGDRAISSGISSVFPHILLRKLTSNNT